MGHVYKKKDIHVTLEVSGDLRERLKPLTPEDIRDLDELRDLGFFIPVPGVTGFSREKYYYGAYTVYNPFSFARWREEKNLPPPHGGVRPKWLQEYNSEAVFGHELKYMRVYSRLVGEWKLNAMQDYIMAEMARIGARMEDYFVGPCCSDSSEARAKKEADDGNKNKATTMKWIRVHKVSA